MIIKGNSNKGIYGFRTRLTYDNGMIYETAAILNLHGYCFDFDAPVLGTQEGLFDTPPPGVYSPSSSPTTVYTTQVVPVSTDPTKERYSRYILP